MRKLFLSLLITLLGTVCLLNAACRRTAGQTNAEPVPFVRLDTILYAYGDMDSAARADVRQRYAPELTAFCRVVRLDSCNDADLLAWSAGMPARDFAPLIARAFPTTDSLQKILAVINSRMAEAAPAVPHYRYATTAWGNSKSIIFDDTIALIALNHYLGADNEAYEHWPQYIRALKRPDMLPYDIVEAEIATAYPYNPGEDGETVLSRMIYEGVLAEAKMQLVPGAQLDNALGFSKAQLADLQQNNKYMWNRLVADRMLYSSDASVIEALFMPMPACNIISPDAPGRAVRYTGYGIVRSYLEKHPDAKLSDMLQPAFYASQSTLTQSAYAPE